MSIIKHHTTFRSMLLQHNARLVEVQVWIIQKLDAETSRHITNIIRVWSRARYTWGAAFKFERNLRPITNI